MPQRSPKFSGGFFDSLIQTGLNQGLPLVFGALSANANKPKGCLVAQVSGDEAMTACVPQVMTLFSQLEAQRSQMSDADYLAAAQKIADIFSDNTYFNQSIGGKSAQIRTAAQAAAKAKVDAIRSEITSKVVVTQNQNPIHAITDLLPQTELIAGVPNIYLFGAAVGLGIFAVMKQKK